MALHLVVFAADSGYLRSKKWHHCGMESPPCPPDAVSRSWAPPIEHDVPVEKVLQSLEAGPSPLEARPTIDYTHLDAAMAQMEETMRRVRRNLLASESNEMKRIAGRLEGSSG